jgi:hypothetical protein
MRETRTISLQLIKEWGERLGHLNHKATEQTLKATTQLVG